MTSSIKLTEVLLYPRDNYRYAPEQELGKDEMKALKEFGERIMKDGQQTPIRIADIENSDCPDLFKATNGGRYLLIDGERRLRGLELAGAAEKDFMVEVRIFPIKTYAQFTIEQLKYNNDRKNTSFTEDGRGLIKYLNNGGTIAKLLKTYSFPDNVLTKKARTNFINERVELTKGLHPNLYPFLDSGLLRTYASKPHQGFMVKEWPTEYQIGLATKFAETMRYYSDKELKGWFDGYREELNLEELMFDPEDESLGIEKFKTKACIGCRFMKEDLISNNNYSNWNAQQAERKGEPYTIPEFVPQNFCYYSDCLKEKKAIGLVATIERLKIDNPEFVWAGRKEKSDYNPDRKEFPAVDKDKDGRTIIRYYDIVEPGTCSSAVKALSYDGEMYASYKGRLLYICPKSSGCTIHHAKNHVQKAEKRTERLAQEKEKVSVNTLKLTCVEWFQKVAATKLSFNPIMDELKTYSLKMNIEEMWRRMDNNSKDLVRSVLGKDFIAIDHWKESHAKQFEKAYTDEKLGIDKIFQIITVVYMIYDSATRLTPDRFTAYSNRVGVDFKKLLKENKSAATKELTAKHKKRKANWGKEKAGLLKNLRAFLFDLPIHFGLYDKDKNIITKVLENEAIGKKVCRLTGVKLQKGLPYVPVTIKTALDARKIELQGMFPDFRLEEKDLMFLTAWQSAKDETHEDLINDDWSWSISGNFVICCIKKAANLSNHFAMAEFLTADIIHEKVTLPYNDKDSLKIATQVIREEDWKEIVAYHKDGKYFIAHDESNGNAAAETVKEVKAANKTPKKKKAVKKPTKPTSIIELDTEDLELVVLLERCDTINKYLNAPEGGFEDEDFELLNKYIVTKQGKWKGRTINAWEFKLPVELRLPLVVV